MAKKRKPTLPGIIIEEHYIKPLGISKSDFTSQINLGGSNGHTLYLFSAPRSMDPYNIQNLDTS